MMCLINYLSACRRLKECDKFIQLNRKGGLPDQILAQRDMIYLEKKYYGEETQDFLVYLGLSLFTIGFILIMWYIFENRIQHV